ncbi:hypothetical protein GGS24DRAFT_498597 [Hypoxylon argillaceum]|nr:hypothetical protein GGS24DRAFT_498597 [Hypoxylon argillaceum]
MSKWERIVDHFKDSDVFWDRKGVWKVREGRPRATGVDPTIKLTDFEVFRDLSTPVRRVLFDDRHLRAEPEVRLRALFPDDDPEADGFIENLVKQTAQGFEKAARGLMQRARAKARVMAAKPGKEEERRGGGREESQVVGSIIE